MLLCFTLLLAHALSFGQNRIIKGKVTNTDGYPVSDVLVKIKGAGAGTVTNLDGNYTISAREDSITLVFSTLGCIMQEVGVPSGVTQKNVILDCPSLRSPAQNAKRNKNLLNQKNKKND